MTAAIFRPGEARLPEREIIFNVQGFENLFFLGGGKLLYVFVGYAFDPFTIKLSLFKKLICTLILLEPFQISDGNNESIMCVFKKTD